MRDFVESLRDEHLRTTITKGIHPYILKNKIRDQDALAAWASFSGLLAKLLMHQRWIKANRFLTLDPPKIDPAKHKGKILKGRKRV